MQMSVVLTVSESKRLIAKGVARRESVRRAVKEGTVVIATGTTNGYVIEEILGERIDKTRFRSGITLPAGRDRSHGLSTDRLSDLVLRNGKPVEGATARDAVKRMGEGDVFIKGANALDYRSKVAGILIGHPGGGTIGAALGHIVGRRIELVLPVGLEKLVYGDIIGLSRKLAARGTNSPKLMPVFGTIVTEIEALEVLVGVQVTLIAAGGVGGAEGSVRLLMEGSEEELARAKDLLDGIHGEPPWVK